MSFTKISFTNNDGRVLTFDGDMSNQSGQAAFGATHKVIIDNVCVGFVYPPNKPNAKLAKFFLSLVRYVGSKPRN